MPEIVEGRVGHGPGRLYSRLPDLAVVVVAAQQGPPGSAAQHVVLAEFEPFGMVDDRLLHEEWCRNVANRARGLGRGEDRVTAGDDHLLVNGDHTLDRVDPVEGEAKRLALPQPRPGAQQ